MVWILYQFAMVLALFLAAPFLIAKRGRHYLSTLPGRLVTQKRPQTSHDLWIHAVSVGEVAVAATLIGALPRRLSILVTTVTPTGQDRALQILGKRAHIAYLPFDLGLPIRRFFDRYRPSSLVLVEGELWPLLLRHTHRRGMPAAVINGRVSDRSFKRMKPLRRLLSPMISPINAFGVQSDQDRDRWLALGVDSERLTVTGNVKYDTPEPAPNLELDRAIGTLAAGRALLIAGSTMPEEEVLVLQALAEIGSDPAVLLLIAPRHPERFPTVARLLEERQLRVCRRSELISGEKPPTADVLLLDSLGELSSCYRLADVCFIGGTLVPTGGHNPLEAARFGKPIVAGASMENFHQIAKDFDREHAWSRVSSPSELASAWRDLLADRPRANQMGERARRLVQRDSGATARTKALLSSVFNVDLQP